MFDILPGDQPPGAECPSCGSLAFPLDGGPVDPQLGDRWYCLLCDLVLKVIEVAA
jgi:hypothetical protein